MRPLALALALGVLAAGCGLFSPRIEERPPPTNEDLTEDEERAFEDRSVEDQSALDKLIAEKLAGQIQPAATATDTAPPDGSRPSGLPEGVEIPDVPALEIGRLPEDVCLRRLTDYGIAWVRPPFETPGVAMPIILAGPVRGVTIRPRWRRQVAENEVLDCRLAVALVAVAEWARGVGIAEVLYYSTWRPPRPGSSSKASPSQHRAALAIDIGWFVTNSGDEWTVLTDYERHPGQPPCTAPAESPRGLLLRDFACHLHLSKAFNVVLTPNFNKAHHNHFHLDLTLDAGWYILR